jgi:glycosyltransferase EpsF
MLTGCSQDVVNSIRQSYGGNGHPWRVLYYGTDLVSIASKNERRDFRRSFGWPDDAPIIVHVGRFAEQKNHFGLIEIFELLLQRVPEAKLLLIGGGALRKAVESVVHERRLSNAVTFLGYRDDVPAILSRSDVFLFPSWFEGLGVAALEASAAALPVVASRVPSISEAVEEDVTGLLRDPKDVEGMADAVIHLLNDADFANRLGTAGRNRIAERFSKRVSADSLLRIYHECLG